MQEVQYLFNPSLYTFKSIILPILKKIKASRIIEIGVGTGKLTEDLLGLAEANEGELDCIDLYSWDDKIEKIISSSEHGRFFMELSSEILPTLNAADAYIIAGDFNYYTVLNDLNNAWKLSHKEQKPFLALVRGLTWPFGRRDGYYNPNAIPQDHVHPHTWMQAINVDDPDIAKIGFRSSTIAFACHEGGEKNGVRTAVLDFTDEHKQELTWVEIPAFLGLGIIYSSDAPWSSEITHFLKAFKQEDLVSQQEEYRMKLLTQFSLTRDEMYRKQRYRQNGSFDEEAFCRKIFTGEGKKSGLGLVSIIIPTLNRPTLVREAIKSALQQTYQDIEIVVVNDGGESLSSLIASFNDKRVVYTEHKTNQGLPNARNTGINISKGTYIAYLDDDDIYYPFHIESLVNALDQSGSQVAYSDIFRVFRRLKNDQLITFRKKLEQNQNIDKDLILIKTFVPPVALLHAKSCLNETGLFDPTLKRYEDWDLWIRLAQKFHFLHVPIPSVEYAKTIGYDQMVKGWAGYFLYYVLLLHHRYRDLAEPNANVLAAQAESRNKYRYWAYSQLEEMSETQLNQLKSSDIIQDIIKISSLLEPDDTRGALALELYLKARD